MSDSQQPSAQPQPASPPYGDPHAAAPAPQTSAQQESTSQPAAAPSGAPQYDAPHHGAPQPDAPQYSAPQYGTPQYGAAAPLHADGTGNPLGRTAFLIAVAAAGLNLLMSLIFPFLFRSGAYDVAGALSTVVGIITLLGSVGAVVLSILALRRPAPHLLAAIALGVAGVGVVGQLAGFASPLFYGAF